MDENHILLDHILQEYTKLGETTVLEEVFIKISHITFILFLVYLLSLCKKFKDFSIDVRKWWNCYVQAYNIN